MSSLWAEVRVATEEVEIEVVATLCVGITAWVIETYDFDLDKTLSLLASIANGLQLEFGVPRAAFAAAFAACAGAGDHHAVQVLAAALSQHLQKEP
jgi:hypothetical protein